jgi:transposase-like protein
MKARIALEAIKEQKTIQEIASHYGVHPSQVTNWKRQAIQGAPERSRIGGRSQTRARKR